ncbi:hypothetical protein [Stieleria varia]|uniref:Cytochrome C n=1 Tax=Stieleria varia TaxID=2528005 RepID=A0A5C5ZLD9_9BACT|nr:hypothetical protein [Stieleria varia]TWT87787.1 hypothetical protein Pla52n_70060 [Stieleria varia]
MTKQIALTCIALVMFGWTATSISKAQQPDDPNAADKIIAPQKVVPLMRMKLDRAKDILEGLTIEDYDKIASNARSLRLLSMEAGWNVVQTEEYRRQSQDFRRACDAIEKAAQAKDINRAALSYVALTVRCVECHTYMRENDVELVKLSNE